MAGELRLVVNGRQVLTRVAPRSVGASVLLPLRSVVESSGGTVEFVPGPPARGMVSLAGRQGEVTVGEAKAVVNRRRITLPAPAAIWGDTLMVPAELLRALDLRVEVDEAGEAVLCGYPDPGLDGRRIFLDPGHGGTDPGAVGATGTREADVTLDVARQAARLFRMAGASTFLSRTSDRTLSLPARLSAALSRQAEVFACVHANSFSDPGPHGTETYYYETWESHKLAAAVQQALVEELGLTDRGVKEASFYVLRHVRVPACLTELAFLSNATEEALLADPWVRLQAAMALFRGIRAFMESAAARLT